MTIEGKTRVQDEGARARLKEDAGLHPEGEDLDRDRGRGQRQIFLSILDDAFMYQQVHFLDGTLPTSTQKRTFLDLVSTFTFHLSFSLYTKRRASSTNTFSTLNS